MGQASCCADNAYRGLGDCLSPQRSAVTKDSSGLLLRLCAESVSVQAVRGAAIHALQGEG